MARPLRIEFPGALYHITARGNERRDIFFTLQDRIAFEDILGQVCARFAWRCHAYCLMSNHYHLLIETVEGHLSQGMRQLNLNVARTKSQSLLEPHDIRLRGHQASARASRSSFL